MRELQQKLSEKDHVLELLVRSMEILWGKYSVN
jgi:hypothetical protein